MAYTPPNEGSVDGTIDTYTPPSLDAIDATIQKALQAPSSLTATVSGGDIVLNWTDNSDEESGFYVYRATSSGTVKGDYTQIANVSPGTTSYTDTTVNDGEQYHYRVSAHNN